jgi:hypothetical protein
VKNIIKKHKNFTHYVKDIHASTMGGRPFDAIQVENEEENLLLNNILVQIRILKIKQKILILLLNQLLMRIKLVALRIVVEMVNVNLQHKELGVNNNFSGPACAIPVISTAPTPSKTP